MCVSLSEQYITRNIQIHSHLPPCHSELYKSILEHFFQTWCYFLFAANVCTNLSLCVTKTQGITSCCLMKDRPHRASYQTYVGTKLHTDLNHTDSKHTHKAYLYTLLFFCKLNFNGDGNSWKQLHRAEAIGSSSINQLSSPTEHRNWKIQQMIV